MSDRTALAARLLLFVVPALWSTNYLVARLADGVITPYLLAFGRWLLAAALLLPFTWRELQRSRDALWREKGRLLVLGVLGMTICGAWVYEAGRTTTSTNIALIYAVTPVTIAACSAWLLHEPLSLPQRCGIALALAGTLFVISRGDPAMLLHLGFKAGDLWIAGAAAAWTAYSVLLKRWPSALGPQARLLAIIGGGLLALLPGALVELARPGSPPLGPRAAGLVVFAALVPGVLSYGAYSILQSQLGATRTALMLYLTPLYGAFGAWVLLGERPGWHHAVGALLILPSIWLATRR